ncbi:two-component sensor histidine kinase [Enterococcus ureilyticus]|uniref:histidine kinase n=1 Tax=Enterococcus ureilyticus TaxID=1131292 RepID=A0A1E5HBG2_9ENTE|nr:ATP-binding protein [Enterococcus ureilyticus]MBM7688872.1 signal transduction histidine kinase [Enterococcus ureilyticus]OEG21980.1 two-component sensor histidine kinase [Enterococcus ureilyticus]
MKNKLTRKLILYFSLTLFLFSLVIGLAFSILFSKQTVTIHTEEMTRRAIVVADTLRDYFIEQENSNDENSSSMHGMMGSGSSMKMGMGYSSFLTFMDQLALDDIWIVDENADTITVGHGMHRKEYNELPDNAQDVIKKVYTGKTATSDAFSRFIGAPTVTVGAPIKDNNGTVLAVVLLHSAISSMHKEENQGYFLLFISILIAWIIGLLLSILLSKKFIAPINKMSTFTEQLVVEDYDEVLDIDTTDEMGQLGAKLTILKDRLAEAKFQRENREQAQKNFLSTISHELRTPVTVIRGSLESLNDGLINQPEKIKQYHQQLLIESIVLEGLINDLLELSRLENPEFSITMEPVSINDILTDSIRSLRLKTVEKQQQLQLDKLDDQPIVINGDYGRIRQLFVILIENALKFSPIGATITIQAGLEVKQLIISIHNPGSYIAPNEQKEIFQRFHQARSKEQLDGTGLGLAIAKEIAERHHFSLKVSSDKKTGTTFYIKIPVE